MSESEGDQLECRHDVSAMVLVVTTGLGEVVVPLERDANDHLLAASLVVEP